MAVRKAFTLIEMLMVISIIGILATLALVNFGTVRQNAQLDIAADSLVSSFKERLSLARSGRITPGSAGENATVATCYGLFISTEKPYVETLEAPYVAVGEQQADYCDVGKAEKRAADYIDGLEVRAIEQFGLEQEAVVLFFKPPFGAVVLGDMQYVQALEQGQQNPQIMVTVALPDGGEARSMRYNLATAQAKRIYE